MAPCTVQTLFKSKPSRPLISTTLHRRITSPVSIYTSYLQTLEETVLFLPAKKKKQPPATTNKTVAKHNQTPNSSFLLHPKTLGSTSFLASFAHYAVHIGLGSRNQAPVRVPRPLRTVGPDISVESLRQRRQRCKLHWRFRMVDRPKL
jgi:hypothetical protein